MTKYISVRDKILNFVMVAAIAAAGSFIWRDIQIKKEKPVVIPPGAVELRFPLSGGRFYVAYRGRDKDPLYGFVHTSAAEKYALDIVKDTGNPGIFGTSLENDPSFGAAVSSPCPGKVVSVQNNKPDLPVGQKDAAAVANSVAIECDGGFTVVMAHFKEGSVVVSVDDRIKAGAPVAAVGNSGNSAGPHLHVAAFRNGSPGAGVTPLPILFGGRYMQKGDTVAN
jgi:hypothetical protein